MQHATLQSYDQAKVYSVATLASQMHNQETSAYRYTLTAVPVVSTARACLVSLTRLPLYLQIDLVTSQTSQQWFVCLTALPLPAIQDVKVMMHELVFRVRRNRLAG